MDKIVHATGKRPMEIILDILQDGFETTADLFDVFLSSYGESYRKARRLAMAGPRRSAKRWSDEYRAFNRFCAVLSRLKKDGLVGKEKHGRGSIWRITKRGTEKRSLLEMKRLFSRRAIPYRKELDDTMRVIIFDVPERERYKRSWLTSALKTLGFEMLQKSVFVGRRKIPQSFFGDLHEREMLNYVYLFEVTKTGSLGDKGED